MAAYLEPRGSGDTNVLESTVDQLESKVDTAKEAIYQLRENVVKAVEAKEALKLTLERRLKEFDEVENSLSFYCFVNHWISKQSKFPLQESKSSEVSGRMGVETKSVSGMDDFEEVSSERTQFLDWDQPVNMERQEGEKIKKKKRKKKKVNEENQQNGIDVTKTNGNGFAGTPRRKRISVSPLTTSSPSDSESDELSDRRELGKKMKKKKKNGKDPNGIEVAKTDVGDTPNRRRVSSSPSTLSTAPSESEFYLCDRQEERKKRNKRKEREEENNSSGIEATSTDVSGGKTPKKRLSVSLSTPIVEPNEFAHDGSEGGKRTPKKNKKKKLDDQQNQDAIDMNGTFECNAPVPDWKSFIASFTPSRASSSRKNEGEKTKEAIEKENHQTSVEFSRTSVIDAETPRGKRLSLSVSPLTTPEVSDDSDSEKEERASKVKGKTVEDLTTPEVSDDSDSEKEERASKIHGKTVEDVQDRTKNVNKTSAPAGRSKTSRRKATPIRKQTEYSNQVNETHPPDCPDPPVASSIRPRDRRSAGPRPAGGYKCTSCGACFENSYRLEKHYQDHADRKYPCEICLKSFKRKRHLAEHLYIHRERRYKCELCAKEFVQNTQLKTHINRIHLNPNKPRNSGNANIERTPCVACPKTFKQSKEMYRHVRIFHPECELEKLDCKFCPRKYYSRELLEKHIIKFHRFDGETEENGEGGVEGICETGISNDSMSASFDLP